MKTYPLDVLILSEFEGPAYGYYSKGHHAPADFVAQAYKTYDPAAEWDPAPGEAWRSLEPAVRHVWWRCVPVAGEVGLHTVYDATPGRRGAFPVTVVEELGPIAGAS